MKEPTEDKEQNVSLDAGFQAVEELLEGLDLRLSWPLDRQQFLQLVQNDPCRCVHPRGVFAGWCRAEPIPKLLRRYRD